VCDWETWRGGNWAEGAACSRSLEEECSRSVQLAKSSFAMNLQRTSELNDAMRRRRVLEVLLFSFLSPKIWKARFRRMVTNRFSIFTVCIDRVQMAKKRSKVGGERVFTFCRSVMLCGTTANSSKLHDHVSLLIIALLLSFFFGVNKKKLVN
jgi:hypothetical protein